MIGRTHHLLQNKLRFPADLHAADIHHFRLLLERGSVHITAVFLMQPFIKWLSLRRINAARYFIFPVNQLAAHHRHIFPVRQKVGLVIRPVKSQVS